jgi:hypothetical protein
MVTIGSTVRYRGSVPECIGINFTVVDITVDPFVSDPERSLDGQRYVLRPQTDEGSGIPPLRNVRRQSIVPTWAS